MRDTHRAVLHNSLGGALKPSGRRSRSRTEPLAPRGAGPAAPSTLAAKPRQPSGIQPSADSSQKPTASGAAADRRHTKWRRKAPTSPAERYYITPWAGRPSNRPEGEADPGQNPWRPGPQARRRHQPSSPQGRVNLREYSQAPIPPQKPNASNDTHSKKAPVIRLVLLS
jgi:hypothetical protein